MIKKVRGILKEFRERDANILKNTEELIWANVYHDSIQGKQWLTNLPLNIGRWAGNYTFFYILNRILNDVKPKSILEFGLGESSKFIATYIKNELTETRHDIIEQSADWADKFEALFQLPVKSKIHICSLVQKEIFGYQVNSYEGLDEKISGLYDFYLIDGPLGSDNFSRYDIVAIVDQFPKEHEFILLLDDYNRFGEKQTANELMRILNNKGIKFSATIYKGNKEVILIATEKYRYLSSL